MLAIKSFFSIPIPIPIPKKSSFQYQYLKKWYFQYQYQYRANTSIPAVLVLLVSAAYYEKCLKLRPWSCSSQAFSAGKPRDDISSILSSTFHKQFVKHTLVLSLTLSDFLMDDSLQIKQGFHSRFHISTYIV